MTTRFELANVRPKLKTGPELGLYTAILAWV